MKRKVTEYRMISTQLPFIEEARRQFAEDGAKFDVGLLDKVR